MNSKNKQSFIGNVLWSLILLIDLNSQVYCDVGDPLFLSTYLEDGRPEQARQMSEVNSSYFLNVTSFAGHITVNKEFNSNTWFWYFPSEKSVDSSPLIIWLQGGPGLSSLYSLFQGVGPFRFEKDVLEKNLHSWHESNSMLFIDNPIGSGYSFTDAEDGYSRNQTQVTDNLYKFLQQFYQIFPELQPTPLFLVGQSYAGKHIPSLAYEIHTRNPSENVKINLQGMAIGNGWIDPPNLYSLSTMAFQVGLIDVTQKNEVRVLENAVKIALRDNNWKLALEVRQAIVSYVSKASNMTSLFNYMADESCFADPAYEDFMTTDEIRYAVHVGNTSYRWLSLYANYYLREDNMVTTRPLLEELLEFYPVLMYNGQLDLVVTYANLEKIYDTLNWTGIDTYKKAKRIPWEVDGKLVGYTKRAGNFEEVMFRNAGHCVAMEKPQLLSNLITDFALRNSHFDKSNEIEDIQILEKENTIDGS